MVGGYFGGEGGEVRVLRERALCLVWGLGYWCAQRASLVQMTGRAGTYLGRAAGRDLLFFFPK